MSRIRFITIRANRLVAGVVILVALVGIAGYITITGLGLRAATPVPKALLIRSLPASTTPTAPPQAAAVGTPAPPFTLKAAGQESMSLASYKGRPVLLYFWASWCSFCRDDMPSLQQLQEEKKDTGLAILTINLLEKEELVQSFAAQTGLTVPMLLDTDGAVSATYLVRATPTYAFIDKEGVLRALVVGRPRPQVFERNLAVIINGDTTKKPEPNTKQSKRTDKPRQEEPKAAPQAPSAPADTTTTPAPTAPAPSSPAPSKPTPTTPAPGPELTQPKTGQAPGITGAPDITIAPAPKP